MTFIDRIKKIMNDIKLLNCSIELIINKVLFWAIKY